MNSENETQIEYGSEAYKALRKKIIAYVKAYPEQKWLFRTDGKVERYFGTSANKSGWAIITYDSALVRKRPGIPQYTAI